MKHFQIGEKYNITLQTWKRYGEIAGECEIVSINEIPYDQIQWKESSIKDCFNAIAGEITVILRTKTNNEKPKTFELNISRNSEEYCKEYKCETEYYWFSPGKRNYRIIDSYQ